MVAYRDVFGRFGDLHAGSYKIASDRPGVTDWSAADPEVRRWAEDHRKALEAWLPTNDRPDSLLIQPEDLRMRSDQSRCKGSAPTSGWPCSKALAWKSRATSPGPGGCTGRCSGEPTRRAAWRDDSASDRSAESCGNAAPGSMPGRSPGMTPELLRQAIGDVEACRAMTSPTSETVRAEYFSARDAVNDTDHWLKLSDTGPYSNVNWYNQFDAGRWAHRFLRREPERSARVLRLITAGYLAQCDRPRRSPRSFPRIDDLRPRRADAGGGPGDLSRGPRILGKRLDRVDLAPSTSSPGQSRHRGRHVR